MTEPRFLEQLQELDAKAAAVREQEARGTAACADVRGVLDRLRVKVGSGHWSHLPEPMQLPSGWCSLALWFLQKSKEAGDVAQLVARLLSVHEALGSTPALQTDLVALVCCPCTQKLAEGRSEVSGSFSATQGVWGQPEIHNTLSQKRTA